MGLLEELLVKRPASWDMAMADFAITDRLESLLKCEAIVQLNVSASNKRTWAQLTDRNIFCFRGRQRKSEGSSKSIPVPLDGYPLLNQTRLVPVMTGFLHLALLLNNHFNVRVLTVNAYMHIVTSESQLIPCQNWTEKGSRSLIVHRASLVEGVAKGIGQMYIYSNNAFGTLSAVVAGWRLTFAVMGMKSLEVLEHPDAGSWSSSGLLTTIIFHPS
ncbi:hypothetical protein Tco_1555966 [Tanacetum coccineum]